MGKLLCLGKNYPDHAKEMREDVPSMPVIFIKPSTSLLEDGGDVLLPPLTKELHHEIELVVLIGKEGKNVAPERAMEHVAGYGV